MSEKARLASRGLPAFILITCTLGLLFPAWAERSSAQDEKKVPAVDKQQKELADLQALVKELQKKLADAKMAEMTQNDVLAATEAQVRQLQKRNMELEGILQNLAKKGGVPKSAPLKLNPPAAKIKGTVEKVNPKDLSIAEISVGADAGLEAGHTLEVFRLQPTPRYLGTMRIVSVTANRAVGQFFPPMGALVVMRAGDQVASELSKK